MYMYCSGYLWKSGVMVRAIDGCHDLILSIAWTIDANVMNAWELIAPGRHFSIALTSWVGWRSTWSRGWLPVGGWLGVRRWDGKTQGRNLKCHWPAQKCAHKAGLDEMRTFRGSIGHRHHAGKVHPGTLRSASPLRTVSYQIAPQIIVILGFALSGAP
jgi:hypothetical protein